MKNLCAKTRKFEEPYEVWKAPGWEWRVLKKWQADDNKPYARWFCAVQSVLNAPSWDYGDCYVHDIIHYAEKVK